MPKFRKKPVVIEAVQWTGANASEVLGFGHPAVRIEDHRAFEEHSELMVQTFDARAEGAGDDLNHGWIYCPLCGSCGVGGCCPYYCSFCKDRHDGETQDGAPPRDLGDLSFRDKMDSLRRRIEKLATGWEHGDSMVTRACHTKPSEYAAALRDLLKPEVA